MFGNNFKRPVDVNGDSIFSAPTTESQGSVSDEAVAVNAEAPFVLPADVTWPRPTEGTWSDSYLQKRCRFTHGGLRT